MRSIVRCALLLPSIVLALTSSTQPAAAAEPLIWENPIMAFHDGYSGTILDVATGTVEKFRIDGYDPST